MMRQGDVLLVPTTQRPTTVRLPHCTLAEGEATGHMHRVVCADDMVSVPPAALFDEPDGTRLLLVDGACALVHAEHGPITLAPGVYRVIRQREYTPEEIRHVSD